MKFANLYKNNRDYSEDYFDELEDSMTFEEYWQEKERLIDNILKATEKVCSKGEERITSYLEDCMDFELNGVNGTFWKMYGVSANEMDKNHYDSQEDMEETINDIKEHYQNLRRPELYVWIANNSFGIYESDSNYFKTEAAIQKYCDDNYLGINDDTLATMTLEELREICAKEVNIYYAFFFTDSEGNLKVY